MPWAIQNALTDKVTAQVTSRLNVTGLTDQAAALLTSKGLPRVGTLLKTFAPSLASAVAGFIHSTVHKIVISAQFARAWVQANTVAHQQLVGALSGQGSSVSVKNGQVRSPSTSPRSSTSSSRTWPGAGSRW